MDNTSNMIENDCAKILWDFEIQTDKMVVAIQPDIVVVNKKEKNAVVVDIKIPSESGRRNTRCLRNTKV